MPSINPPVHFSGFYKLVDTRGQALPPTDKLDYRIRQRVTSQVAGVHESHQRRRRNTQKPTANPYTGKHII